MKDFKELTIQGSPDALPQFIEDLERSSRNGWSRSRESETAILRMGSSPQYCYICDERVGRPGSALWLAHRDNSTLYASNIVPRNKSSLTYDEYNAVLDDFANIMVAPAAAALGLKVQRSRGELRIEDLLSKECYQLLKKFSGSANHSTGSSHPNDQERWFEFLIQCHRERNAFESSDLLRWLEESEGWGEDVAFQLIVEYERARSLLSFYDSKLG